MTKSRKLVEQNRSTMSRGHFIGTTAAAAAAAAMLPGCATRMVSTKGNRSNFGGVQIGAITYSFRSMPSSAEEILGYSVDAGLGSVELMSPAAEAFAGIPESPSAQSLGILTQSQIDAAAAAAAQGQRYSTELTEEQQAILTAAQAEATAERLKWRLSPPLERFEALRKMYNDEGVNIHIVKFSPANWSDEEIDYAFIAARACGAYGVTNEGSNEAAVRLGPFAEKHGMYAVFHNHGQEAQVEGFTYDALLSFNPYNALNYDFGHSFGFTGESPVPKIERLYDRIKSLHAKDKMAPTEEQLAANQSGPNMPWGEGETPIAEILLLLKKKQWPINVDIELEYPIPEGSNAVIETRKCVEFMRDILV